QEQLTGEGAIVLAVENDMQPPTGLALGKSKRRGSQGPVERGWRAAALERRIKDLGLRGWGDMRDPRPHAICLGILAGADQALEEAVGPLRRGGTGRREVEDELGVARIRGQRRKCGLLQHRVGAEERL